MQRFFDIILSLLAIILISPLIIFLMFILKFSGEGEIFYSQSRIGYSRKNFSLIKFATMLKNSPDIGSGTITVKDDPRILPIGKFLRFSKLNELPQLFNILIGDMSFIGPRPLTQQTFELYDITTQELICNVRPGLSGVGSIVFRDEENIIADYDSSFNFYKNEIAPYKGALEIWYVKNNNIGLYFLLIIYTLVVVIYPNSSLLKSFYNQLPPPPDSLSGNISFKL